jgi:cytochrome c-type biogenesis protein CcmH
MRRAAALMLVAILALGAAGPALAAVTPRASLTDIEGDVMCPSCKEPLEVAQSPQAQAEKSFIQGLIDKGYTKSQIEQQLVGQYGLAVLGKPPAHGFNLTVYILPPALVLAGAAILAYTLPKWRRRSRAVAAGESPMQAPGPLTAADAQRLDEDLARHP